jgi:ABC-type antimicrobial peptide transport system permease subunit
MTNDEWTALAAFIGHWDLHLDSLRLEELMRSRGGQSPEAAIHCAWVVTGVACLALLAVAGVRSSFGVLVQPPTPFWGGMLGDGRVYMLTHWWLATFPGLAIFITTLGINLPGDGLRDLLDPHRY